MTRLALLALAALLAACSKNIQNPEAVRSAVLEYLAARAAQTGLNMGQMQVEVATVSFEKNTARTTVSIKPKGVAAGMQISYTLDRKGDKWVVRPGGSPHPTALPEGAMPSSEKAPPIPPGASMPAGHPPIGKQ